MDNKLVYDVGCHNGNDSAYYLHLGYRVIGVEANPIMADLLRKRFSNEISNNRFVLLDVGLAASNGEMNFWICDDNSEWSSFNLSIASRAGAAHHSVPVKTRTFETILGQYGVPFYCKIDIEGNDRLCLMDLNPGDLPMFVSIEMSHRDGNTDINLLHKLGYRKFKIISQVTRAQPLSLLSRMEPVLSSRLQSLIRRVDKRFRGVTRDGDWEFSVGSSGVFGDKSPGPWVTRDRAVALWRSLHDLDRKYGAKGWNVNWFDIHASRSS